MIAKNSACPCGSGKQYKRCCIDKPGIKFHNTHHEKNANNLKNGYDVCLEV